MANELFLTTAQTAHFAGVTVKAVKARTRCKPGEVPLVALDVPGVTGTCFDAVNVAAVFPAAAAAIVAALSKKEDATA